MSQAGLYWEMGDRQFRMFYSTECVGGCPNRQTNPSQMVKKQHAGVHHHGGQEGTGVSLKTGPGGKEI